MKRQIIWWKDRKLMAGFIIVILSFVLGFYGKVVIISRFYEPIGLLTGLSIYAFSFVLLFIGVFLVGWETVKIMQRRIHHHVKETAKKAYHHAKELPKRGYEITREFHKKSIRRIKKSIQK